MISYAADVDLAEATSTPEVLIVLSAAVVAALAASSVLHFALRRIGRHSAVVADLARRGRMPSRLVMVTFAVIVALNALPEQSWSRLALHLLSLAMIAFVAWLIGVFAFVFEDLALNRYRMDVADNRHARRVRTQVSLVRRFTVAVIAIIAVAAMLMTFPSVRVAGASIVASAGVVGIVAGLAAQTSLANMFAGMQLAFTDAIRVDDVVVVEEEWGRIEEITLTYVVVHIWDDRRMILPSTYFTTTPFQNWTRKEAAVLGAVELDLDFSVPFDAMRAEMHRTVEGTDLWDGRVAVLQVTEAVGGFLRVRVLVSGKDGPTVFDLRCLVREQLVSWLRTNYPQSLPRQRLEWEQYQTTDHSDSGRTSVADLVRQQGPSLRKGGSEGEGRTDTDGDRRGGPAQNLDSKRNGSESDDANLFSGSGEDAAARARAFAGPGDDNSVGTSSNGDGRRGDGG